MEITPECRLIWMKRLWDLTQGKAWEPPQPNHRIIVDAIKAGYLRRVNGRCGFEMLKDAMVDWTEAGRAVMVVS